MGKTAWVIVIAACTQFLDHLHGRIVLLAVFFLALVYNQFVEFHSCCHQVNQDHTPLPFLDFHLLGFITHGRDAQFGEIGPRVDAEAATIVSQCTLVGAHE